MLTYLYYIALIMQIIAASVALRLLLLIHKEKYHSIPKKNDYSHNQFYPNL